MTTDPAINGYRQHDNLVVTRNGKALIDQARGVRLFKDATGRPQRYRVVYEPTGAKGGKPAWFLYHAGRVVIDTPYLATGMSSPGAVLDWLRHFHRARNYRKALE